MLSSAMPPKGDSGKRSRAWLGGLKLGDTLRASRSDIPAIPRNPAMCPLTMSRRLISFQPLKGHRSVSSRASPGPHDAALTSWHPHPCRSGSRSCSRCVTIRTTTSLSAGRLSAISKVSATRAVSEMGNATLAIAA